MIYLDSAATTFQKPAAVRDAMARAMATMSSPGRGNYPAAQTAAETAFDCRSELAELFHAESPEQVIFTSNATHGLNIAIKTLVKPGSHVVISGYEHNAVTRPLSAIPDVRVTVAASPLFRQEEALSAFERAISSDVDVVICNHVSNVFGCVLPLEGIAALCRSRNVPLIVDASQSAGVLPLDLMSLQAAFIAMPGHKGLYGPQGTGVLLCNHSATPLMEGGTGSLSVQQEMPDFLPDRLEAGTHNMPGIAGLLEGVRFVRSRSPEVICQHERELAQAAAVAMRQVPGIRVFAEPDLRNQVGVLSFLMANRDVEAVGEALANGGVAVRAGFHCAPLAHQTAGTLHSGTVRLSFSAFNSRQEISRFLQLLRTI
ncbi:aminotransferase class V-fold PLP-dependent enzyme [Oscillibacter hominis]|uniref:Aminotransferase class V-fold PLP-dependent enzyme n=1 Tax=Oscillibacter hominis TaxID=2763056 RepID=A0A7G9B7S8_9FIRM|nr:aminotransferase class V-fold PLP-dependent enzyme [Oscillibacter hominis]QNL45609.1 aminotransferase class V-fold PLP-dependent enzyme [Oscillibacter hominis]